MIRHYYHVFADGQWCEPVDEHLAALRVADVPMRITVGIVGSPENRVAVREALRGLDVAKWVEADTGWEQVTLETLVADLASHDDPVLYAHSKGAHNPSEINVVWRRSMSRHVVAGARHCLDMLATVDAVGCHWLTKAQWPTLINVPIFGGNFWWAKASFLRTLPPLRYNDRWDAEGWIGLGDPHVYDLLPGWPSLMLCTAEPDAA